MLKTIPALSGTRGQAPLSMCDETVQPSATIHTNRKMPLLYEFTLKPGPVTLLRISQSGGKLKMILSAGEMLRRPMAFTGTSGVVRFNRPVEDVLPDIMNSGIEHHLALAYGDHRDQLRSVAAGDGAASVWRFDVTIRYGLIGSGMMGQEHIRNLNLLEAAQVVAIADPDDGMRNLSAELVDGPVTTFSNHRDLLSADLCDAYVVVAPNDTHHKILIDLLDANKPVLCEKPLCTTAQDCRDILTRMTEGSAPVWVAMEYRYMPPVQRLIHEVQAGTAGPARMMSIREHRFPFLPKIGDWNRFNERTGGTLVEKMLPFLGFDAAGAEQRPGAGLCIGIRRRQSPAGTL